MNRIFLPKNPGKVLVQNGGVGGDSNSEVTGAANILARLGLVLDLQSPSLNGTTNGTHNRTTNLQNNTMHLSKEHVVEVKEEDERRTSPDACLKKICPNQDEDDSEERNKARMTNSATQTQAATPDTPSDCQNVASAGEKEAIATASLYHSAWPPMDPTLWHSGPSSLGGNVQTSSPSSFQESPGMMSASSSVAGGPLTLSGVASRRTYSQQQLGAKVEMVYGLLSMLGTHDRQDMSRTLLAMSSSPDSCVAMRQSGCLPLLVQLLHSGEQDAETRSRAAQALHNMVHAHPDDKRGRREARVLKLLEQIRLYCDTLQDGQDADLHTPQNEEGDKHPGPTIAALMKLSFDEEHRHAMCQLGGLHAIAQLIQVDHEAHGSTSDDQNCVTLRRYAGMALTNLTFGDGTNKALLCSFRQFMRALVAQLTSPSEDLRQVTASVLRNLSWRADSQSKQTLREVGAVTALMSSAMEAQKESTLKSVLSALWNLSAHCSLNKVDICAVDGALAFLVQMLSYKAPSKTLAIIENAGGILRNISSHVAVREDYRSILREHNCLQVLLQQLKSPSLTVVSNACGTLWNLSARCQEDQRALWALGAPAMLRSLVHSKHKMISMGSSATLKNLLSAKPENDDSCFRHIDSTARSLGLQSLPGLYARKQKALEQELDQTLAETCDNIEPSTSPSTSTVGLRDDKFVFSLTERDIYRQRTQQHQQQQKPAHKIRASVVSHSDSKESITSTHSDSVYERLARMGTGTMEVSPVSETRVFHPPVSLHDETKLHASLSDSDRIGSELKREKVAMSDRKFLERYNNNMMREGNGGCKSNEPVADPNQNSVAVNHIEKGLEAMNINEETPPKECSMNAWEEPNSSSSVVTKKAITSREEVGTATSISEEDEAAENAKQLNNNNVPSVNGNPVVPGARVSQPASFTPARNKYLEAGLEEDLECPAQDRPIDFSRRYPAESDPASAETAIAKKEGSNGNKETPVVYGDYAETDLDQPTDYSLQYGEEDDLSDFEAPEPNKRGDSAEFYSGQVPICIHEDTVKTYCTEGTPYETPYNFSTATSLSDLRIEPPVKEENTEDLKAAAQESSNLSDICSLPEIKDGSRQSGEPSLVVQESGSVSPAEKPVQFCEEGTPGVCMSRFSSLSSLDKQDVVSDVVDGKSTTDIAPQEVDHPAPSHTPPGTPPMCQAKEEQPLEREANKMPSLNCEQQYAEETPLMFSRASSLGSLSSYEQQSILDDRSSVVSEFSRLTSGVVSPSELPDSPSQLVPPSPRHAKAPVEFTSRLSDEGTTPLRVPTARFAGSTRPLAHPIAEKDAGVFEDRMAAYKVEDTPVEFSRATSLSSLSIDDEPRDVRDGISKSARSSLGREDGTEKADVEKELALVSEGEEEEDEDMLAACINIGMQNSRSKQSLSSQTLQTPQEAKQTQQQAHQQSQQQPQLQQPRTTGLRRPVAASSPMQRRPLSAAKPSGIPMLTGIPMPTGIPVKVSPITRRVHAPALSPAPSASPLSASRYSTPVRSHSAPGKSTNESSGACEDSMYRYCTEGTPANISHAGSHSDLSVLSFPTEGDEDRRHDHTGTELSDDSSTFSGDNENILAECIQSGMPKAKSDMSGHTPRQPHTSPANPLGNAKRVGVSNTSLAGRRVASASPSGSSKTPRSPHVSPHPSSPSRNPNNSPQRKPGTTGSPQRTYPQASPQRSPQRSLAGPRKVTNNVPKSGARLGMKPPGANPSSSQVSTGHPGSTPPRQRPTGGARIVRAVNRNVYPGAKGPEATAIKSSCLPEASAANDEIVHFASEDSPCNFSSRSSLSDLTINSSECGPSPGVTPITHKLPLRHPPSEGPACDSSLRFATEDTPVEGSYAPSLSSLGLGDDDHELPEIDPIIMKDAPHLRMLLRISEGSITDQAVVASAAVMVSSDGSDKLSDKQQPNPSQSSASEEVLTVLSRNASLSSLSVESLGSCEPSPSEQALLEQCINSGMPKSRTKSGDSAFKKIISKLPCPVEGPSHPRMVSTNKRVEIMKDSLPSENGATPGGQESWRVAVGSDRERPRFNSEAQSDSGSSDKAPEDVGTVEKKFNFVEDVDVMKASATSNGTWADDSSPNDISYPSISISAPIAASVRSDNYRELSDLVEENNDSASEAQDLPSLTDSWMLEAEATKVASAVMGHSLSSLDSILPPSEMGSLASLSQSYSGRSLPHTLLNRNCSRKKSLPAALNNGIDTSIEFNMSSSCTSQLENLKAPSVLDEMGDSENSFMSIASITSEAADLAVDLHKDGSIGDATYELIRPAAKLVADAYAKCAGQQVSQLDTQDPPSTFQEITELSTDQDLTLEPGTETIASDTEMNDEIADSKTLEAPDLPCDSQHTTPAQSATPSSAESTPKKESKLKKRITPKQRREMTRDRYQTYTISSPTAEQKAGPDTVQQEQLQQSLPAKTNTDDSPTPKERRQMMRDRYQTYTITTGADSSSLVEGHEVRKSATVGDVPDALKKKARTTPKQRRQEDRDRFRTRTLEKDSITGAQ